MVQAGGFRRPAAFSRRAHGSGWGVLGLISLPFRVSFLLSLRRLVQARQPPKNRLSA